jgi:hypothetical protein
LGVASVAAWDTAREAAYHAAVAVESAVAVAVETYIPPYGQGGFGGIIL